jgi:hypothetical protein
LKENGVAFAKNRSQAVPSVYSLYFGKPHMLHSSALPVFSKVQCRHCHLAADPPDEPPAPLPDGLDPPTSPPTGPEDSWARIVSSVCHESVLATALASASECETASLPTFSISL